MRLFTGSASSADNSPVISAHDDEVPKLVNRGIDEFLKGRWGGEAAGHRKKCAFDKFASDVVSTTDFAEGLPLFKLPFFL